MGFRELDKLLPLKSESELIDFFLYTIDYRDKHKNKSCEIAIYAFDKTHPASMHFKVSRKLESIRFELGSLEAPVMPEDDRISPEEYENQLWKRLQKIITINKEKGQF